MEIELWLILLKLVMIVSILIPAIKKYLDTHLQTLIFLIVGLSSFLVTSVFEVINYYQLSGDPETLANASIIGGLFTLTTILFATLIAYYMILLFLESTESMTVKSKRMILLGVLLTIISVSFLVFTILGSLSILDFSTGRYSVEDDYMFSMLGIWVGWSINFLLSLIFNLVLIVMIYRQISSKQKSSESKERSSVLRKLKYSVLVMFIGSLLPWVTFIIPINLITNIGNIISTGGLILFVMIYLRNGVYILGNQSLRRLIMINDTGTSIYGYIFQDFDISSLEENTEQEVLFSGAIRAITTLLNELTGSQDDLIMLELESTTILVERINNQSSVLLMVDTPTLTDKDALQSFVTQMNEEFDKIPTTQIDTHQVKKINNIVVSLFGPGQSSTS